MAMSGGAAAAATCTTCPRMLPCALGALLALSAVVAAADGLRPGHEAAAKADAAALRELLAPRPPVVGWRAWFEPPPPPGIDARDELGRAALHLAAQSNAGELSHSAVAALLGAGAIVDGADGASATCY
jgi:hypothetical protein